jgi:hypothetical protein
METAIAVIVVVIVIVFFLAIVISDSLSKPQISDLKFTNNYLCHTGDCGTVLKFRIEDYDRFTISRKQENDEPVLRLSYNRKESDLSGSWQEETEHGNYDWEISLTSGDFPSQGGEFAIILNAERDPKYFVGPPQTRQATTYITVGDDFTQEVNFYKKVEKVYGLNENQETVVVGAPKFEYEAVLSGPSAQDAGNYRVCSEAQLRRVECVDVGVFFDEKNAILYPDTDPLRHHPQELHVIIRRGDHVLLERYYSEGQGEDFAALDIDGSQPLTLYAAMESGPEGNYQEGFEVAYQLHFQVACPG